MGKGAVAEEFFLRGEELLRGGDQVGALEAFRQAYRTDPSLARYASAYGLGIALVERRFKFAKGLCEEAVRLDSTDPKLFLNLARVYLLFGFRAEGVRALDQGLSLDRKNQLIIREMMRIGFRRAPVIPFLARSNFFNKWLGKLRAHLKIGQPVSSAEAFSKRI